MSAAERQETLVPCFVCAKLMLQAAPESPMQPAGGVTCLTYGNFGSRVYDPNFAFRQDHLVFVVCDGCITERKDRVRQARRPQIRPETTYTEWPGASR